MSTFNFNGNNTFGDNTKFIGMNWIKITPETELPKRETNILLFNGFKAMKGRITGDLFHCSEDHRIYIVKDFTHYCIITNPEQ